MKLLLDTQLLLWAAESFDRLPSDAQALMGAADNELLFSVASLWEIAVKRGLGRDAFKVDARVLRRSLLDNGYSELSILSEHAVAIDALPPIHNTPLIACLLRRRRSKASRC